MTSHPPSPQNALLSRDAALALLHEHTEGAGLRKHAYAVEAAMRAYAPARPLPGTDEAARRHLALPMSAALTRAQCVEVTGAVRAAQRGGREKPATVRSS